MRSRLVVLIVLALLACENDDELTESDLMIYVDRFYDEAVHRNVNLDRSALTVMFVDASEIEPYSGVGESNPPRVRIAKSYWGGYTELQKEILMFHELGHAVLRRSHLNEKLPNCEYKSMMLEGNQFVLAGFEKPEKRKYYLDELFNSFTPYPSWGGAIGSSRTGVIDDKIDVQGNWLFANVAGSTHTGNIDNGIFASAPASLHINSAVSKEGAGVWHLAVPFKDFPTGSTIIVTLKVKTRNATATGAYAFLEGEVNKDKYFFTSTRNLAQITGTTDWTEYQLILNCYPASRPGMVIDLYFDGAATGDVWYDDIRVDYYN